MQETAKFGRLVMECRHESIINKQIILYTENKVLRV